MHLEGSPVNEWLKELCDLEQSSLLLHSILPPDSIQIQILRFRDSLPQLLQCKEYGG